MAAAALVAGAAAVLLRPTGPSYPKAWDPRVAPIASFVQSDRGLTWKHPVNVEFLAPAAFVKTVDGGSGSSDPAGEQDYLATARALGLMSGTVDLGAAGKDLQDNSVVGLYIPKAKTVYVRGATLTPFVRVTLAHELTHALQDQYFPLGKLKGGPTDDESATTALVEGDAVRVQDDYARTMSSADQTTYGNEAQSGSQSANTANHADSVPDFLSDSLSFPYDFGPTFVESLVRQGGNAMVDSALRHPPSLDGQIVDPTTYQVGLPVPKVTLAAPPAGARLVQPPGGFGEVPLVEALGYEVGFASAWSAVQGWTADRFDAYRLNGRVCADVTVLDDSAADAGHLLSAAQQWAAAIPGTRASISGMTVQLASCDPGVKWKPRSSVDPYPSLAARSFWIGEFEQLGHLSVVMSSCVVDDLLSQVGAGTLTAAANASSASDPSVMAILAHERADLGACS